MSASNNSLEVTAICANCQTDATQLCDKCELVVYCDEKCKTHHWPHHKEICNSDMFSDDWKPIWILEDRDPAIGGDDYATDALNNYLWGNMPAIDVLKLNENEKVDYKGPLNVLFAASGDIRNVGKTIAELPMEYSGRLTLYVNDLDKDVVARNAVLLMMLFEEKGNDDRIVDAILHTWYSAFLTKGHLQTLEENIRPIYDLINESRWNTSVTFGARIDLGKHSLTFDFDDEVWARIRHIVEDQSALSFEEAKRIRARQLNATIKARCRDDYRDYKLLFQLPHQRPRWQMFYNDGILLPFADTRVEHDSPNPTLFNRRKWLLQHLQDPNKGWDLAEVSTTKYGPTKDSFGKLYCYVKNIIQKCRARLATLDCDVVMLCMEAENVGSIAKRDGVEFDRIECSNITDDGYLKYGPTVQHLSPLLKSSSANECATLITLCMRWTKEITKHLSKTNRDELHRIEAAARLAIDPILRTRLQLYHYFPNLREDAKWFIGAPEKYLTIYQQIWNFAEIEREYNVQMQPDNTITKPFCYDVQGAIDANGNIDDALKIQFWNAFASLHYSLKSYIEWRRKPSRKRRLEEGQREGDDDDTEGSEGPATKKRMMGTT